MRMIDMFCSSPASTATRKSHQHEISYSSSTTTPRLIRVLSSPCRTINDVALSPNKPGGFTSRHDYKQLLQRQKSSSSSSSICYETGSSGMEQPSTRRRRSSADARDVKEGHATMGNNNNNKVDRLLSKLSDSGTRLSRRSISDENKQPKRQEQPAAVASEVVEKSRCSISTSSSSSSSRLPPISAVSRSRSPAAAALSPKLKSSSSSQYHGSADKVVVLWVSLHCKGCEAKVRKHISKMEGVKSFSTDWMSKRVTIISNMDPHDVLASVSAVKYAHFWPSSSSSSSSSSYYYSPSPSSSSSAALLTLTR